MVNRFICLIFQLTINEAAGFSAIFSTPTFLTADRQSRERGEVQPIRDEMELLESERRILIPGCCTEEREKGREGEREGEEEEEN